MARIAQENKRPALEDERVVLQMDKRQLTWRQASNAYASALKDAATLKTEIQQAEKGKGASGKDIAKMKSRLGKASKRTHEIFNACVGKIVPVALDTPALGEKMLSDMLAWKEPEGMKPVTKFNQIWQVVAPALGKIGRESQYHAALMLTGLAQRDPREERSAPPVPGVRLS